MVNCHYRTASFINLLSYINANAVNYMVWPAVNDNTFHIRELFQLFFCNIMGINLTVNTHSTDFSRQYGVLCASQVKNDNHILFHRYFLLLYFHILHCRG